MPFDFKAYDQKCQGLTLEELQREWQHYTRLISGAATSTAVSGCAIPLTLGVSTIGVAMAAPAIHNARKKREIIERHLNRLNSTHQTRKRDVLGSMAVSGTIGVVTLGVGTMGAEAVATAGAEHGIQSIVANETAIKIVSHAALDGAGMMVEHKHTDHLKKKDAKKAFQKAGVFQAVQDAKAAEAGYTVQQYPNSGQYVVAGPSQALPMPPPPYSAAVGQAPVQPTYPMTPNGYPQDFKAQPVAQPVTYLAPQPTGPQQIYDYSQQQQVPVSYAPSPMPSANGQIFSPPQTPAIQYPPQQQASLQPQPVVASYTPTSTAQPFNMSAMQQALPTAPAPATSYQLPLQQYAPMSPTQDYVAQSPPAQILGAPQAGYCPPAAVGYISPPPATPSGYPPSVILSPQQSVPAVQMSPPIEPNGVVQNPQQVMQPHTGYQPPVQTQTQVHAGYLTPQPNNNYQAPLPIDPNRRDSVISTQSFTPQPYNPQHYGPISQQEQVYNASAPPVTNTPMPAPQAVPPPMQYQMPPTPLPTGSTIPQYDNKGSYFPAQPQTPQATGGTQPAYQPQYYPPPSPMPVTQ
ncbi:uncharacterized protein B0J16DRAFT_325831 [Fusarium flagelliforme]|nr:uncharacterized protein B0J16DRAFT_325831 [Fusarium flagelliforme]KAH7196338.1 hypothetical protein B0J16DRAFT_325831 [Fusarium flagelliforme]